MNKDVIFWIIRWCDETVALLVAKPFDGSSLAFGHGDVWCGVVLEVMEFVLWMSVRDRETGIGRRGCVKSS